MKNIIKSIVLIAAMGLAFSCADDSLDPVNINKVKKGKILALRGVQLENIYDNGLPGYEVFPKSLVGDEVFEFDAEYLAEDPTTLESFDIFVIKRTGSGTSLVLDRILLRNVPFSEFVETDDYRNPWVSVAIDFADILNAIDQDPTSPTIGVDMLAQYPAGIAIESDLNLTNGTKVLASEIVAAGLFSSNQFYPAQRLNIAVTNYCPEDIEAEYDYSTIVTGVGVGGDISGCAGAVTGSGEFVNLSRGKYSISDATFGQYDCAWGDTPAVGVTIINTCDEITLGGGDQYDLVYTLSGLSVTSGGTVMTFNWENDYGDTGTTTLTRTDGGAWPLTLFTD